jgi:hypothetical protein
MSIQLFYIQDMFCLQCDLIIKIICCDREIMMTHVRRIKKSFHGPPSPFIPFRPDSGIYKTNVKIKQTFLAYLFTSSSPVTVNRHLYA